MPYGTHVHTVWVKAIVLVVFSFVVEFNVLPVYSTLPVRSFTSMITVLCCGVGLTYVVYASMAVVSIFTVGGAGYEETIEAYAPLLARPSSSHALPPRTPFLLARTSSSHARPPRTPFLLARPSSSHAPQPAVHRT